MHDHFLRHPAIAPLLKDGELLEYGCHLTIEDGPAMVSHDITRPGLVIIGDAAGFTLNTGMTIRGMDLAAGSALAAATAVHRALEAGDVSQRSLSAYRAELDASFVGKDMATYRRAPAFLETSAMYTRVGPLAADIFHNIFNHDLRPRRRLVLAALDAVRASPLTIPQLMVIAWRAVRSL